MRGACQLCEDRVLFWVSLVAFLAVWLVGGIANAQETNDVLVALRVAKEYQLNPFQTSALFCVRAIENGREGREYGVLDNRAKGRDQATQARWAAGSIKRRLLSMKDLTSFAARWAPIGADNDPKGLNRNWQLNLEMCLAQLGK